jgi:hypothetical protein
LIYKTAYANSYQRDDRLAVRRGKDMGRSEEAGDLPAGGKQLPANTLAR